MTQFTRRNFIKALGASSIVAAGMSFGTGATTTARVAAQTTTSPTGKIVITQTGPVKLHTYIGPDESANVTSHLIELRRSLVMVDCQFWQSAAADWLDYINSLDKPLERVILSHSHPDHWLASNTYADVPFVSTETIATEVETSVEEGMLDGLAERLGEDEVPEEPYLPVGEIEAGEETIDGETFVYDIYENAEATEQIVIRLPEAGVAIVQDLIYSNVHFFPLGVDVPNWMAVLRELRGLAQEGYTTLLPGHGVPTTLGELDQGLAYLAFQEETLYNAITAEDAITALMVRYPMFAGVGILNFVNMLYPSE